MTRSEADLACAHWIIEHLVEMKNLRARLIANHFVSPVEREVIDAIVFGAEDAAARLMLRVSTQGRDGAVQEGSAERPSSRMEA